MFLTLNYHIINRTIHDTIAISEEAFAAQLRYLHTHDYTTLSLDQAIAIVDGKQEAPPRSVLLTFDDFVKGVEDFGTRIQPLMNSRRDVVATASPLEVA